MAIKNGATVRQKVTPIEGVVAERRFNDSHDQMEYLIESPDTDGDGEPQRRWFLEGDLDVLSDPADVPATGEGAAA